MSLVDSSSEFLLQFIKTFSIDASIASIDLMYEMWTEGGDDCNLTINDRTDETLISENYSSSSYEVSFCQLLLVLTASSPGIEREFILEPIEVLVMAESFIGEG